MQLTGPSPATFGLSTANVVVTGVSFDLVAHRFSLTFYPSGGDPIKQSQTLTGNIPTALQNALESHAQGVVETALAWAAGSSTVTAQ